MKNLKIIIKEKCSHCKNKQGEDSAADFFSAAALGLGALDFSVEHRIRTAHPGFYSDRLEGAVPAAGPAFDAGIAVDDFHFFAVFRQYLARTDVDADFTARALIFVELQCNYVFEIF
jgi:hypothetical protein